jgi:hypothetical protein
VVKMGHHYFPRMSLGERRQCVEEDHGVDTPRNSDEDALARPNQIPADNRSFNTILPVNHGSKLLKPNDRCTTGLSAVREHDLEAASAKISEAELNENGLFPAGANGCDRQPGAG